MEGKALWFVKEIHFVAISFTFIVILPLENVIKCQSFFPKLFPALQYFSNGLRLSTLYSETDTSF